MKKPQKISEIAVKVIGLKNKVMLTERAKMLGLNPADVHEAFGHPNPHQEEFDQARKQDDMAALWGLFKKSQKGSIFAKKVLREILRRLNGPADVPEMWNVYHMSSGQCDLAEEILHKINISTSLLHNWMDVIRHSKSGDEVHEEAVRLARMHTDARDVLWTLFRNTENYKLRKAILSKILAASNNQRELLQVLAVAEQGYPKLRNRCLQKLIELPEPPEEQEKRPRGRGSAK